MQMSFAVVRVSVALIGGLAPGAGGFIDNPFAKVLLTHDIKSGTRVGFAFPTAVGLKMLANRQWPVP